MIPHYLNDAYRVVFAVLLLLLELRQKFISI